MQLVFDLDGVLLDSESDLGWLRDALDATLESIGKSPTTEHRDRLAPGNLRNIHQVADDWGLPAPELWRVRNEHYLAAKLAAIRSGAIEPFDDIGLIEAASVDPAHIISNSPQPVVEAFVETNGFDGLFEVRLGRGDELDWLDRLKPAPYFYDRLVAVNGGHEDYLYVGNAETDRAFAETTGMGYHHVDRPAGDGLDSLVTRIG